MKTRITGIISFNLLWVLWILILSCTKGDGILPPKCERVYFYSDFYTRDSIYLETVETKPFKENNLICGGELDKLRKELSQWLVFCSNPNESIPLFIIEHRRIVIGSKSSFPVIFKK